MTRQPTAVVQPIPVPHRRFSHLHVDLVVPLPTSPDGFKYIFTVTDRSTRWLEAIPVKNLEATMAADALVEGWISRFGVPADITTDKDTIYLSGVGKALQQAGSQKSYDDRLPPRQQWAGRTCTPPAKGFFADSPGRE
jgi:hypothetical protein